MVLLEGECESTDVLRLVLMRRTARIALARPWLSLHTFAYSHSETPKSVVRPVGRAGVAAK